MSSHGRPKGETAAARKRGGFLIRTHGRPNNESAAARGAEVS